jgi:hypothetical protein
VPHWRSCCISLAASKVASRGAFTTATPETPLGSAAAALSSKNAAESVLAKLPSHSVWPALRDQVDLFHEAFPGRRCAPFFRKLEEIEKRKLSFTDRNTLIKACLRLIERKKNAKTAEAFRTKLSWENEEERGLGTPSRKSPYYPTILLKI